MSVTKLISKGKAYDELFDTAVYIQTDDGVGMYEAYENALRNVDTFINIPTTNTVEGYFVANVPTGQVVAEIKLTNTYLKNGRSYTLHYETSEVLDQIRGQARGGAFDDRFLETNPSLSGSIDFDVIEDGFGTNITFKPFNLDTDILVKCLIIKKGYPKLQAWGGSSVSASLSGSEKSYSWQLNNFQASTDPNSTFLRATNSTAQVRFSLISQTDITKMLLSVKTDDASGTPDDLVLNSDSNITLSLLDNIVSIYENGALIKTIPTQWTTPITDIITLDLATDEVGFDFQSLSYSTEESIGYIRNTEPSITPTCKLGLSGSEIDLPSESRIQSSINRVVKELESESANATLHTQFIATKDRMTVSYDVISEEDVKLIKDIEALQWQNNTRLSYIYNEESGNLITKTVKATVTTPGNRLTKSNYFDYGLTIEMKE